MMNNPKYRAAIHKSLGKLDEPVRTLFCDRLAIDTQSIPNALAIDTQSIPNRYPIRNRSLMKIQFETPESRRKRRFATERPNYALNGVFGPRP
jgi:hypothetical protein